MKRLVMITKSYPYDYGEEFLENEIEFLSGKFEKITIFATSVIDSGSSRKVPANVECIPMSISTARVIPGAGINYLYADRKLASPRDISAAKQNDYNKKALAFFIAKSKLLCRGIKKHLDVSRDSEIIIYSFWLYDTACAAVMLKKALTGRCKSVQAVSRAHGYDLYEYRAKNDYIPLREYLLNNLDMVYPCSDNGSEYLKDRFPECGGKNIKTKYLGVRDNGCEYPCDDGVFTIVSCAYISPLKRIERLAHSLTLLGEDKKYRWVHLGGGDALANLKEFCAQKLKSIEVEFKGSVKNSEIIDFYKENQVDLFVNTSMYEGLPVSIMEAQSFGIPVVATNVGGSGEIVKNGVTGYLIPADFSDEELAEVIIKAASLGNSEYGQLCKNSRENYLESFSADKNYSEFANMLSRLC